MTIELINQTHYANIYGLYNENGKPLGTKEVKLAGHDAGTYYYSVSALTRKQIKDYFKSLEN